jgi:hypothetical protein
MRRSWMIGGAMAALVALGLGARRLTGTDTR